nr:tetratricopeptide repeat protein [Rickettsia felis]
MTLFNQAKYHFALKSFDSGIKLEPYNPHTYFYKALTMEKLKRYNEALELYNIALELDPNYPEAKEKKARNIKYAKI